MCPWSHPPAPGVTHVPLGSPTCPWGHPPAPGQALPFPEPGELLCSLLILAGAGPPGTAGTPARAPENIPRDAVGSVSSPRPPPRCYCNLYLQARDRESARTRLVLVETVVISCLRVEKGCVRQSLFDSQSRNTIAALASLPLACVPGVQPPEESRSLWV